MTIATTTHGTITVIKLSGELDDAAVELLTPSLSEVIAPGARIVVDLANVSYMNSAGLGALINATARANLQECRIVLAGPDGSVANLLEITKLTRFFEVVADVEAALARLGG